MGTLAPQHHGQAHGLQMCHCVVDHLLWDLPGFRPDGFLQLVGAAWFVGVNSVLHIAPQEKVQRTEIWGV